MDDDDDAAPLGIVPLAGRGRLPFALLHGESLVACASWALGEAEVDLVDFNVGWEQIRDSGRLLVLHDPLCPLTPASFVTSAIELARTYDEVVVAVHTDPDSSGRREVVSPIVLPARVVAGLAEASDVSDFTSFVTELGEPVGTTIHWLEAPPSARRVSRESEIRELEAIAAGPR